MTQTSATGRRRRRPYHTSVLASIVAIVVSKHIPVQAANVWESVPDATTATDEALLAWADGLAAIGETQFKEFSDKSSATRKSSPEQWESHIPYQILVDRFNNGDPDNDRINIPEFQVAELASDIKVGQVYRNLLGVPYYRHGGDLQGIINRLDYLKELGIGAIQLSSIYYNNNAAYDGACVSDPLRVDPNFGSLELLQTLVHEAHKLDLLVIMDYIPNHLCDKDTMYQNVITPANHNICVNKMELREGLVEGESITPIPEQGQIVFSEGFFKAFKRQEFFSRCGEGPNEDATSKAEDMFADGFREIMDFNPNEIEKWNVFDFDTTNEVYWQLATGIAKYWIAATDVDGFHVPHLSRVTESFAAYFAPTIRDYAQSKLAKLDFLLMGSVQRLSSIPSYVGTMSVDLVSFQAMDGIATTTQHAIRTIKKMKDKYSKHNTQKYPGFTGALDVAHSKEASGVFRQVVAPTSVSNLWTVDVRKELSNRVDLRTSWVFLDQQDWTRFRHKRANSEVSVMQTQAGIGYLLTTIGTPTIYYGTEQGFTGNCLDESLQISDSAAVSFVAYCENQGFTPHKRQTMWASAGYNLGGSDGVAVWAKVGAPDVPKVGYTRKNWALDPFLHTKSDIFKSLQKFLKVRNSCVPFRKGDITFRECADKTISNKLITYSRGTANVETFVVINSGSETVKMCPSYTQTRVPVSSSRGATNLYVNLFDEDKMRIGQTQSGDVEGEVLLTFDNFDLQPFEVAVFVRQDLVLADSWDENLGTYLCRPDFDTPPPGPDALTIVMATLGVVIGGICSLTAVYYFRARMFPDKKSSMKLVNPDGIQLRRKPSKKLIPANLLEPVTEAKNPQDEDGSVFGGDTSSVTSTQLPRMSDQFNSLDV